MPQSSGSPARLGPYELGPALGAGGMGEVYRARDTRLGRDVAIKILPPEFAADPDRLRRFEREARAAAALNHPNLLALFDVGTDQGTTYLVTELLEGETLRSHLGRPLPLERAIKWATQIADGLAAAHDQGIVHRDLKPENILVTSTGAIKILDFGLAKPTDGVSLAPPESSATHMAPAHTEEGVVIGTPGYMAPEQVRGQAVDTRADIFSFGCVLFEMVTGRRAFDGATAMDAISAVLTAEPEIPSELRSDLAGVVRRCLAKQPGARFQSAADLAFALKQSATRDPVRATTLPGPSRSRTATATAIAVAAVIVAAILWAGGAWRSVPAIQPDQVALEISGFAFTGSPAISRDGSSIAFRARGASHTRIGLRRIGSIDIEWIPRTEGAIYPFFSPDGREIAFFADRQLKKVNLATNALVTLCDAPDPRGGTWLDDGRIVFAALHAQALSVVPSTGGTPSFLTTLQAGEQGHRFPVAVPGSQHLLFVAVRTTLSTTVVDLAPNGERQTVVEGGTAPRIADGELFFVDDRGQVTTRSFDPSNPAAPATQRTLPIRPAVSWNQLDFAFAAGGQGTLVYLPVVTPIRDLVVVGPGAERTVISKASRGFSSPRASPRGDQFIVSVNEPGSTGWGDLWLGDFHGSLQRLTEDGRSRAPVWSPDGSSVAVESMRDGHPQVYLQKMGERARVVLSEPAYPSSWPSDDRLLIGRYTLAERPGLDSLFVLDTVRSAPAQIDLKTQTSTFGRVSPDGRWLAFVHRDSGQSEVYLTALPPSGVAQQVSRAGGRQVVWSKTGNRLHFVDRNEVLMYLDIGPTGAVGEPRPAAVGRIPADLGLDGNPVFDTLPGGRFITVAEAPTQPAPANLTIYRFRR